MDTYLEMLESSEREIRLGSVFVKDFVKWKAQMINSQIIFEIIYFEF